MGDDAPFKVMLRSQLPEHIRNWPKWALAENFDIIVDDEQEDGKHRGSGSSGTRP